MPLRVIFAEDNYLAREGTSALPSVSWHRTGCSPDTRMPPTLTFEGIDPAMRICVEHPQVGIVMLSQYAEDDLAFELLSDGVAGLGYRLKADLAGR